MEIKTANLKGIALDWAVAEALGKQTRVKNERLYELIFIDSGTAAKNFRGQDFSLSSNAMLAAPILNEAGLTLQHHADALNANKAWSASKEGYTGYGPDLRTAGLRCIVGHRLGATINVPVPIANMLLDDVPQMLLVDTEEISERDLDWAVAKAMGQEVDAAQRMIDGRVGIKGIPIHPYHLDLTWQYQIMDNTPISVRKDPSGWYAVVGGNFDMSAPADGGGINISEAVLRCWVNSKLGVEVEGKFCIDFPGRLVAVKDLPARPMKPGR